MLCVEKWKNVAQINISEMKMEIDDDVDKWKRNIMMTTMMITIYGDNMMHDGYITSV